MVLGGVGGRAARGIEFKPPPPLEHERVAGVTPEGLKLYRLPADWQAPSGGIDQKAVVAQQKKRREAINNALGIDLQMAETPHYLIFSNASPTVSRNFLKWCEALYANLLKQFALPSNAKVWDGKCILILFCYRRQFESYARRYDGMTAASRAGAYFGIEAHGPGKPNLTHICVPIDTEDPRRLQELFAHEGTHAFFELYKTQGHLPLWLHEGLAEFMTTVNDRYRVALTLVDFLLKAGRGKFKRFIDNLKDGMPQEKALQDAYGWNLRNLEARWRIYVTRAAP